MLEQAGADLWALQILQNTDGAPFALRSATQALYVVGVILVRAMGKIQAGYIHAEAKQVAHHGFGVAGRTDGADDLGATDGFAGIELSCGMLALLFKQFLDRILFAVGTQLATSCLQPSESGKFDIASNVSTWSC